MLFLYFLSYVILKKIKVSSNEVSIYPNNPYEPADCFKWANSDSFFLLAVMLIKTHIPNMVISATQVYVWAKKP